MTYFSRIIFTLFMLSLTGCSLYQVVPDPLWDAWYKRGSDKETTIKDMRECGYGKDVQSGADLPNSKIAPLHLCMEEKGYKFDFSSFRANNCYGTNAPYPCRAYWGGGNAQWEEVKPNN
ncbi:MAG TPA: hypothetical protein EYM37_09060 [Methylophaga aminisulfidivorans]|jgi:hypothetical protein|uniref:Lipoprotein n=1 Tax=Methylophaga thalassica TaxID=40223 RepID=A0ABQ5TV99_9GAMM|nr:MULTISPECIES: hypothetical protein [Methylophaga]GLP99668.1 hypothetical protein GCM10007891_15220 [Methylophaga thalassica]HIC46152.1 hypothetical protein [Methylophaga sp.]HIM40072.1 hypothetical protein [Methylophaga aminisulfidivorans]